MTALKKKAIERVVVITGASAGVGRAVVQRFAAESARLALIARDAEALDATRIEAERLGAVAVAFPLDVADAEAVFAAARDIESRLGPIDIWINDAMLTVFSKVSDITPEEFRRVTEVTYLGFVHGTMAALKQMRARNRGVIVQVGSALAYRGIPLQAAYCGAKYAVRGFTDALRTELIHERSGIKLTMVQLPAVNTPQFDWARTHMPDKPRPVPPVVQPDVVADYIFRAALSPRREIWVGASTLKVILGNMIVPSYVDRYLACNVVDAQGTGRPVGARQDNLFHPITRLHRKDGSFGNEAGRSALALSGFTARGLAMLGGIVLTMAAGYGVSRAMTASRARLGEHS